MVIESNSSDKKLKIKNFEGLEVGAISVKWVRKTQDGELFHEIIRHEGNPLKTIKEIFNDYKTNNFSKVVITGQAAKKFLVLPYYSEVECLEKALSYLNIKPDILITIPSANREQILLSLNDLNINRKALFPGASVN